MLLHGRSEPPVRGRLGHLARRHSRFGRDFREGKLSIDGLWALEFGNNGGAGPSTRLFFTAGPNDETDGLFGSIDPA